VHFFVLKEFRIYGINTYESDKKLVPCPNKKQFRITWEGRDIVKITKSQQGMDKQTCLSYRINVQTCLSYREFFLNLL
jgi:hypothetical protein